MVTLDLMEERKTLGKDSSPKNIFSKKHEPKGLYERMCAFSNKYESQMGSHIVPKKIKLQEQNGILSPYTLL